MKLSVLILTYNEEINLARCLESVQWADDVLLVDSFSTDQTVEIARAAGVRVLQHPFKNFAEQRNFGLAQGGLKHEWVLHLDADEVVTEAFRQETAQKIQASKYDAFRVASRMMFEGRWLKHAAMYPSYQVRLGRRDKLNFIQAGHGQREALPPEGLGTLTEPLIHHGFGKGLHDWMDKHNRYSTDEARHHLNSTAALDWAGIFSLINPTRRRWALKQLFMRLPCRPALRFFYMYILRRGFLDGVPGYHYCRLLAIYEYLIVLKMQEIRRARRDCRCELEAKLKAEMGKAESEEQGADS
jgi:glycosyltransferase involved in cell wall biosynthesis